MTQQNARVERLKRPTEYENELNTAEFWAEVRPKREPLQQIWFLPLIVVLLAASIPWYRKSGEVGSIVAGLPVWVWMALVCSALISIVTAVVALFFWDDDESGGGDLP